MFFARSASRAVTPSISFSAPTVIDGQLHGVHLVAVERAVLERVRVVAGLLQVAVGERVGVDDQRAALRQVGQVRLQRRRVHRDEHVRAVARRQDVVVGEVELEARDARQRAGGRADLGGEVGEASRGRCPESAVSEVKRPPVSCMPSPESPAKRMTTDSSCSTGLATRGPTLALGPTAPGSLRRR